MPTKTRNTTYPTPSLNKLSPAILVSRDFFKLAARSTPNTATGSVGDIKAPNTRAIIRGAPVIQLKPTPATTVDRATPIVAINSTTRQLALRSVSLTWSAPANSKSPSMPSSKAEENSKPSTALCIIVKSPRLGQIKSTHSKQNDALRDTIKMPMAEGRRRKIEFIAAKAPAKTMSAEEICKNVISPYGIDLSQFLLTLSLGPTKSLVYELIVRRCHGKVRILWRNKGGFQCVI